MRLRPQRGALEVESGMRSMTQHGPDAYAPRLAALKARSERFPIETTIRFRKNGDADWSVGTTVNISSSGVLFRSEEALPPKTVLEMEIRFPRELTGGVTAEVVCWGPVVRSEPASSLYFPAQAAASILGYRFTHE